MTNARLLILFATLAAGAAGAIATAALKPDLFMQASQPDAQPPTPPGDPLARFPADLAELLASPKPDSPARFIRLTRVKPEAFCKSLAAAGLKNAAFRTEAAPMRGWTCVTDLVKPVDGDDQSVSSLFVAVRGLESDRVEILRMKLNLLDPATAPAVMSIAGDLFDAICRSLGWEPPGQVVESLDRLKQGRILDRGVAYDLRKEFGDSPRYNFIITFPRSLGPGGEDRFVADPRRSAVAR